MESENNQLRLVEVGIKNFNDLIDLAPFESQNSFVAENILQPGGSVREYL